MPPSRPDSAIDYSGLAAQIHASGRQMVVAVTGGGSGAVSALLQTPGASRSVLEAIVPYSLAALVDWIGGTPDQACSEATARAMAMAAFERARELAPGTEASLALGIGCTASLASDRPKRGARRIHAAVQTIDATSVRSLWLTDVATTREQDEAVAGAWLLSIIAEACGVGPITPAEVAVPVTKQVDGESMHADAQCVALVFGDRRRLIIKPRSLDAYADDVAGSVPVVFPGAFNPPHVGHLAMAALAEKGLNQPVAWELSVANVDKPPLDFCAIAARVAELRQHDAQRLIVLTYAPTFREKAELFPGATFVVGADTIARIAQPRYYGDDATRRDEAVAAIAERACRFLVFGRTIEGRFTTLDDLQQPAALRAICTGVPAAEFREDVSSTELRSS